MKQAETKGSKDGVKYVEQMTDGSMDPAIKKNWLLVVDPLAPVNDGDYIVLKRIDGSVIVRELGSRNGDLVELARYGGGLVPLIETVHANEVASIEYCWPLPPSQIAAAKAYCATVEQTMQPPPVRSGG